MRTSETGPDHAGPLPGAVGLRQSVQRVTRSFDTALAQLGGSRPVWHILLALDQAPPATQRELAGAVGIREATLTHHLRGMEDRGLVVRTRESANRRVQRIDVTESGQALYRELRSTALDFDRRLREAIGPTDDDVEAFFGTLRRLADAVDPAGPGPDPEQRE